VINANPCERPALDCVGAWLIKLQSETSDTTALHPSQYIATWLYAAIVASKSTPKAKPSNLLYQSAIQTLAGNSNLAVGFGSAVANAVLLVKV